MCQASIQTLLTDVTTILEDDDNLRKDGKYYSLWTCVTGQVENSISRFLANLLNPKGLHGQGEIFLRKFLDMLTGIVGLALPNTDFLLQKQIIVKCEDCTTDYRRIDITVEFVGEFIIGIENKVPEDNPKDISWPLVPGVKASLEELLLLLSGCSDSILTNDMPKIGELANAAKEPFAKASQNE